MKSKEINGRLDLIGVDGARARVHLHMAGERGRHPSQLCRVHMSSFLR